MEVPMMCKWWMSMTLGTETQLLAMAVPRTQEGILGQQQRRTGLRTKVVKVGVARPILLLDLVQVVAVATMAAAVAA
jgi:hypothetical protein